jgi:hypothetical protein
VLVIDRHWTLRRFTSWLQGEATWDWRWRALARRRRILEVAYPARVPLAVAFIAASVLCLVWQLSPLPGSIDRRARKALQRRRAELTEAPTPELLSEARRAVRFERWERFAAGNALVTDDIRSDVQLRDALAKLFAEVTDEDREMRRHGRDCNDFEFHDSGLALVVEVLEERLKGAPRRPA